MAKGKREVRLFRVSPPMIGKMATVSPSLSAVAGLPVWAMCRPFTRIMISSEIASPRIIFFRKLSPYRSERRRTRHSTVAVFSTVISFSPV